MRLRQHLKNRVRCFNKHFLNRVTRRLAGTARGPLALIRHVGRRSGKPYETPLIVVPEDGGFVIALTYGPEVDWYRNVVAAGGCQIVWHGKAYTINQLEPLDPLSARPLFPQPERLILGIMSTRHFVRLRCQAAESFANA